jgi:ABC-type dipeptide/oligopeptide/nickel transport system ATPase component
MATLLEVRNLHTTFMTAAGPVRAVDGVSWDIAEGETVALVGESGCGKSVSALSIMRLVSEPAGRIEAGEVLYKGRDLLKLSEAEMRDVRGREIAMVFQEPSSLNPVFTVCEQISDALRTNLGLSKQEARERVVELLSLVGIPSPQKRLDSYVHEFSGGMRQRVMLAMALSCNPDLLIADEPTTALDVTIQATILDDHRPIDRSACRSVHHPHPAWSPILATGRRDVRLAHGRARREARNLRQPATSLHGGPLELDPAARRPGQVPYADRGFGVQHDGAALGL